MFKKLAFFGLFLSILLSALIVSPKVFAQVNPYVYPVSGVVFDDRNANGYQDFGEMGIPGKTIYADNTGSGYRTTTNQYGFFQLNVPNGVHSIEIAGAGAGGSIPTTTEKIPVSGSSSSLRYGIQQGGYTVDGRVIDEYGNPVRGATVYVDRPTSGNTVTTDQNGYYKINNVGYDNSTPVYGVSGGHNVYVLGYDGNPVLVNPQSPTVNMPANLTVRTNQGGQCTPGQVVGSSYAGCNGQQYCTNTTNRYRDSSCATYQDFQGCRYINGQCGYGGSGSGQCTPGQAVGSPFAGCNGQQYCTNIQTRYRDSSCSTYQDYQACQYINGQCGYGGGGQQCTPNTQAGQPYQGCSGNNQYCTLTPTYGTNCQISNVATNCQYISGQCGYQSGGSGQCVQGQRVPGSGTPTCNNYQQRCMVYSYYSSSNCSSTYRGGLEECQYVEDICSYNPNYGLQSAGDTSSLQNSGDFNAMFSNSPSDYNNWAQTIAQPTYQEPVTDFWSGDMWANDWYQQPVFQDVNYDQGWVEQTYSSPSYDYGYTDYGLTNYDYNNYSQDSYSYYGY